MKDKPGGDYKPISFGQFRVDINALGTSFVSRGMKGKKIAVIGENSYEWVVTYFAVVNGAGVIVPIDRELHQEEVVNLLERAGVSAIVHSGKLRKLVNEIAPRLTGIEFIVDMALGEDEDAEEPAEGDTIPRLSWQGFIESGKDAIYSGYTDYLKAEIDPEAMCSLLFTSGTTGMAKGVMLSHRNIAANVMNMSKYVNIRKPGIGLSVLPMHHTYEMTCHIMRVLDGTIPAGINQLRMGEGILLARDWQELYGLDMPYMIHSVCRQAGIHPACSKAKRAAMIKLKGGEPDETSRSYSYMQSEGRRWKDDHSSEPWSRTRYERQEGTAYRCRSTGRP